MVLASMMIIAWIIMTSVAIKYFAKDLDSTLTQTSFLICTLASLSDILNLSLSSDKFIFYVLEIPRSTSIHS